MHRNLKRRLAALEALEVEPSSQYPAVALMHDAEIVVQVIRALRSGLMYCWNDWRHRSYVLCELFGLNDRELEAWYCAMKPRVQPLIDAHADEIRQLIPPHNGDGRITSTAVRTVLRAQLDVILAQYTAERASS